MKKKYYILVLTFLCILCGQASYAFTDGEGYDEDWSWSDYNHDGMPDGPIDLDGVTVNGPHGEPQCYSCDCNSFFCPGGDPNNLSSPDPEQVPDLGGGSGGGGEPVIIQGTGNTNNLSKDYVPKSTDKLVKPGIITTCEKQSKLPVCILTSLEVTLNNVLGLTVTNKEISTAAFLSTRSLLFLQDGLTPDQAINLINSFCVTEALTKNDFKTAIDNGNTFLTDFKTGTITTPNSLYPDDRTKDITTIISHSVSVIGYDEDGNFIYIDPALGKAQVAPSSEMGFSYSIIIKGKK